MQLPSWGLLVEAAAPQIATAVPSDLSVIPGAAAWTGVFCFSPALAPEPLAAQLRALGDVIILVWTAAHREVRTWDSQQWRTQIRDVHTDPCSKLAAAMGVIVPTR
jgi:hypothetical protein